jgi:hypothetical protein
VSTGRVQLVTLRLLSTHQPWVGWQSTVGDTSVTLHSSPVYQLAECFWSHFGYSPLITRGSAGRAQLVTLMFLTTHHPWISWQSTAGHTSVPLHSSPMGQLAEYNWSHFCYSPLITHGSAGRVQLVTLLLLSTHHPLVSWQSTAGHTSVTLHSSPVDQLAEHSWSQTSVTLHSSPMDQLAEHSWSHLCYSPLITRVSAGRAHWSHFGYSPLNTRVSPGGAHRPHFCYSPLIIRGSTGREILISLKHKLLIVIN